MSKSLRAALRADSYCQALLHLARDARDSGYRHTMRAAARLAIRHARQNTEAVSWNQSQRRVAETTMHATNSEHSAICPTVAGEPSASSVNKMHAQAMASSTSISTNHAVSPIRAVQRWLLLARVWLAVAPGAAWVLAFLLARHFAHSSNIRPVDGMAAIIASATAIHVTRESLKLCKELSAVSIELQPTSATRGVNPAA